MNLAIDCFKLIKGDEETRDIYELTRKLILYLGAENTRRDMEHHIMIMGNDTNQNDMDCEGISFLLMDKDPTNRRSVLWWELFGVASIAPKLGCDRIFFPCGRIPVHYKRNNTVLLYDTTWKSMLAARYATRIIVTSDETKEDIVKHKPRLASKIHVLTDISAGNANPMELGGYWTDLFTE